LASERSEGTEFVRSDYERNAVSTLLQYEESTERPKKPTKAGTK